MHHEVHQRGTHTGCPDGGHLTRSPGMTGRPDVVISALSSLPSVTISILTTNGHRFISRGVEGDFPSLRLTKWWHCLLVCGFWPTPRGWEWLAQGWHHPRSLQQWGLQWQGLQWCEPQCLSLPVHSSSQLGSPPHGRLVLQRYGLPWGRRDLLRRYAPNGEIQRGEAWRRHPISKYTSHGSSWVSYSSRGGGHSIPWSLLDNLAP